MRRVLIASALLLASLAMADRHAAADSVICKAVAGGGGCVQTAEVLGPGTAGSKQTRGPVDPDYITVPRVVKEGEPARCVDVKGQQSCDGVDGLDLPAGTGECL